MSSLILLTIHFFEVFQVFVGQQQTEYLGHIISLNVVSRDNSKIEAMVNCVFRKLLSNYVVS